MNRDSRTERIRYIIGPWFCLRLTFKCFIWLKHLYLIKRQIWSLFECLKEFRIYHCFWEFVLIVDLIMKNTYCIYTLKSFSGNFQKDYEVFLHYKGNKTFSPVSKHLGLFSVNLLLFSFILLSGHTELIQHSFISFIYIGWIWILTMQKNFL